MNKLDSLAIQRLEQIRKLEIEEVIRHMKDVYYAVFYRRVRFSFQMNSSS